MQRTYTAALVLALLARPALAIDQTYFGDTEPGLPGTCCAWIEARVPAGQNECPADLLAQHPTCRVVSDADFWRWLHATQHDAPILQRMKPK